jgi:hypothetical protein
VSDGTVPKAPEARLFTVGWREHVDFPEWGLHRVKVKIDTGAQTSALGVAGYELRAAEGAVLAAELRLALDRRHPQKVRRVHVPVLGWALVRNTGGDLEKRPLVETVVRLGPVCKPVRLTLTDRSRMRFPVILGRSALEGDFVVDVRGAYLLDP